MTGAEEVSAQRWVARHLGAAVFGTGPAYARARRPSAVGPVLAGLALTGLVWAVPPVVDVVRGQAIDRSTPVEGTAPDAERRPE